MTRAFVTILALILLAAPAAGQSHNGHATSAPGPWSSAPIEGFRSAQFGMNEASVRVAIARDFGAVPVMRAVDARGRITLSADLPAPFPAGGDARAAWTMVPDRGLIEIEIAWPGASEPPPGELADAVELLRDHLASFVAHRPKGIVDRRVRGGGRVVILADAEGRRATLFHQSAVTGHREQMTLKYTLPDDTTVARDPSPQR